MSLWNWGQVTRQDLHGSCQAGQKTWFSDLANLKVSFVKFFQQQLSRPISAITVGIGHLKD